MHVAGDHGLLRGLVACVAGAKRGRGRGEKKRKRGEKGREPASAAIDEQKEVLIAGVPYPLSPIPLLFPPYPLPLSPTPASRARDGSRRSSG